MTPRRAFTLGGVALALALSAVLFVGRGSDATVVEIGTPTRQATFRSTVTASGEIVAMRYADIGSSVMGRVVSLPVSEGDVVKAGQIVARIDAVQAETAVASATGQVQALEAEQRASADQVEAAVASLAAAEARAMQAGLDLTRAEGLRADGLIPASDFDAAKAAADVAAADRDAAKAALARSRQALDATARRVDQARAERRRAGDVLAKTDVVSPLDGVVTRLSVREGEMVVVGIQNQPGTTLMTISDLAAIDAEVQVAEADLLHLQVGQPAQVTLDAIPGRNFAGRVVEIGASALPITSAGAAAREFRVVVRLDAPDPRLRPGLTCDAEIVTAQREDVLTLPLQSVVLRGGGDESEQSGVFVVEQGIARFRPVRAGIIGGLAIEIEGIDAEAPVVIGPYQVLRDLQDGDPVQPSRGT
jgi:HlyD family secretion protein